MSSTFLCDTTLRKKERYFLKFVGEFSACENEGFTTLTGAKHSTLQKFTFTDDSTEVFGSNLKHPISLVLPQINVIG